MTEEAAVPERSFRTTIDKIGVTVYLKPPEHGTAYEVDRVVISGWNLPPTSPFVHAVTVEDAQNLRDALTYSLRKDHREQEDGKTTPCRLAGHRITHTCGNKNCLNPKHMRIDGLPTSALHTPIPSSAMPTHTRRKSDRVATATEPDK